MLQDIAYSTKKANISKKAKKDTPYLVVIDGHVWENDHEISNAHFVWMYVVPWYVNTVI